MAAPRRKRSTAGHGGVEEREPPPPLPRDGPSLVPDLLRRAVGLGLAGLFSTEEVLRKALGDTVPREWVEFAAAQSARTRRELTDRLASELGKSLQGADLQRLAERLLRSHTVEISARLRFVPRDEGESETGHSLRVRLASEEEP